MARKRNIHEEPAINVNVISMVKYYLYHTDIFIVITSFATVDDLLVNRAKIKVILQKAILRLLMCK